MDQGAEIESERAQTQKSHREFGTGLGRDSMKGQDAEMRMSTLGPTPHPEVPTGYSLCELPSPATTK